LLKTNPKKILVFEKKKYYKPNDFGYTDGPDITSKLNEELLEKGITDLHSLYYEHCFMGRNYNSKKYDEGFILAKYELTVYNVSVQKIYTKSIKIVNTNQEVENMISQMIMDRKSSISVAFSANVTLSLEDIADLVTKETHKLEKDSGIKSVITSLNHFYKQISPSINGMSLNISYYKNIIEGKKIVNTIKDLVAAIRYTFINDNFGYSKIIINDQNVKFDDLIYILLELDGTFNSIFVDNFSFLNYLIYSKTLRLVVSTSKKDEVVINKAKVIIRQIITPNMSVEERLATIHDYLAKNVEYDKSADKDNVPWNTDLENINAFTAYGALIDKKAVCDGYSKAFWILSLLAGVQVNYCSGEFYYSDFDTVRNTWNSININGKDYHIDVTADSLGNGQISRACFLMDRKTTLKDRRLSGDMDKVNKYLGDAMAPPETFEKACQLKLMKIAEDNPNIQNMNSKTSRLNAAVSFVKLLGKEQEALASNLTHPYTDVPAWADKYIAYLYSMKYIVSDESKKFNPDSDITFKEYSSYILRTLGYKKDFEIKPDEAAEEDLLKLGVIASATELERFKSNFMTGDFVDLTYAALMTKYNSSDSTLLEKLYKEDKSITFDDLIETGIIIK